MGTRRLYIVPRYPYPELDYDPDDSPTQWEVVERLAAAEYARGHAEYIRENSETAVELGCLELVEGIPPLLQGKVLDHELPMVYLEVNNDEGEG